MKRHSIPLLIIFILSSTHCKTTAANGISNSSQTAEQLQRDRVKAVIENDLSSQQCKQIVQAGASNDSISLKDACTQLEAFQSTLVNVGCLQDDYDKLHKVICWVNSTDCIPASASSNSTKQKEEKQRERIKFVIENEPSSSCRSIVLETQPVSRSDSTNLQDACLHLESYRNQLISTGCTGAFYENLHQAICNFTICMPPEIEPSNNTVVTTPSSTNSVEKEKIMAIVQNNLSSEQCKAAARSLVIESTSLQNICEKLEANMTQMTPTGCTDEDYRTLHTTVCNSNINCSILAWRKDVEFIIDTKLTTQCKAVIKSQMNSTLGPQDACLELNKFKDFMRSICQEQDFKEMHMVLCEYMNNYKEIQKQKVLAVIGTLSKSCTETVMAALNSSMEEACTKLSMYKQTVLSNNICTSQEVTQIEEVVCIQNCDYRNDSISNDTISRESRVRAVLSKLGNMCQRTALANVKELSEPPERACSLLRARKGDLMSMGSCSDMDYSSLEQIVCYDTEPFLSAEERQRQKALSFVKHNLTSSCYKLMWPQVQQFSGDLTYGCHLLKVSGPTLILAKSCTESEIKQLENLVCYEPDVVPEKTTAKPCCGEGTTIIVQISLMLLCFMSQLMF